MPPEVSQIYKGSLAMTGAFRFADDQNLGAWDGGWGTLSPGSAGAFRMNDKNRFAGRIRALCDSLGRAIGP